MTARALVEQNGTTDRKWVTVMISLVLHAFILGALIMIPLIYMEALPVQQIRDYFISPPAPPAAPRASARAVKIVSVEHRISQVQVEPLQVPREIPQTIPRIVDEAPAPQTDSPDSSGVIGGMPGPQSDNPFLKMLQRNLPSPPKLEPSPAKKEGPTRIPMVSTLSEANLIFAPRPAYPSMAKSIGLEGSVVLEAVISTDGGVENLQVLSGHPLLVKAAVDAVLQWRYRPTLLNGEPVEVLTTIKVNFKLH